MFEEANRTLNARSSSRKLKPRLIPLPALSPTGKGITTNRTSPMAPSSVYRSCITGSALQLCWLFNEAQAANDVVPDSKGDVLQAIQMLQRPNLALPMCGLTYDVVYEAA